MHFQNFPIILHQVIPFLITTAKTTNSYCSSTIHHCISTVPWPLHFICYYCIFCSSSISVHMFNNWTQHL